MIVVSDAGPIIALSEIEKVHLLEHFFDRVIVPEAVYREVAIDGKNKPGSEEVEAFEKRSVSNTVAVEVLKEDLGPGEAEALILTREIEADILVMDDRLGRRRAKTLGLSVTGTLALLHRAVESGLIKESLETAARALRSKGVWLSDEVIESLED